MKKILYPTDFSPTSLNAFVYALKMAKKINAEIVTLHVHPMSFPVAIDNNNFLLENYNIVEWGDFDNFKSEVPTLRAIADKHLLHKIKMSHILERGNVVDEILNVAQKEKPDFIIMGTTGASGIKEVFLGSVTEKIMNKSHRNVLAIPKECKYEPIKKILFLTLSEKYELGLRDSIQKIASLFDAQIDVLKIKKHHEEDDFKISLWRDHFTKPRLHFSVLASDDIEDTVLDFITLNHINMTVVTVHQKGFFERLFLFSLSRQLAYHTTVPLLGIPI